MKTTFRLSMLLLLINYSSIYASKVDTVLTVSASMNKQIKAVVITPDSYSGGGRFPVLYLLHGYSDNYACWVRKMPSVKELADRHQMIIVCPDGNFSSWYYDSPVDPSWRYETYVAQELVVWTDKNYRTIAAREGRAITGLSMGGHGGLFLGLRHQDVFGACGSMSGGVDIRPFPNNWDIAKRIGEQAVVPENWEAYSVINQLFRLTPGSIRIIFDCGTEDFFYNVNVKLHEELRYRNIPHDFISRPGGHNAAYWDNAVQYQALFFSNFFRKSK